MVDYEENVQIFIELEDGDDLLDLDELLIDEED